MCAAQKNRANNDIVPKVNPGADLPKPFIRRLWPYAASCCSETGVYTSFQ